MASYHVRQRDPLIDRNMQAMLERRGKELLGVGLLVLAAALAALLGSYSPGDPGWMVVTDEPAQNLLGRAGAAIASTLMIIGGHGAWGLPVVAGVWGVRFLLHIGEDRALGRVIFALLAVALASVYAATLVPGPEWVHSFGLGGLFGDTVLGAVLGASPVTANFGLKVVSLMIAVSLVTLGLFVLGFDGAELRAIARFLLVGLVVSYAGFVAGLRLALIRAGRGALALKGGTEARLAAAREARAAREAAQAAIARDEAQSARERVRSVSEVRPQANLGVRGIDPDTLVEPAPAPRTQAGATGGGGALGMRALGAKALSAVMSRAPHAATPQPADLPLLDARAAADAGIAAPQFMAPQPLRADPRPLRGGLVQRVEPAPAAGYPGLPQPEPAVTQPAPAPAPRGLLARVPGLLRRNADPLPELVERELPATAYDDLPSEDRIKARISDVIRAKARRAPQAPAPVAPLRPEPPVLRKLRPQPLIVNTAPGAAVPSASALRGALLAPVPGALPAAPPPTVAGQRPVPPVTGPTSLLPGTAAGAMDPGASLRRPDHGAGLADDWRDDLADADEVTEDWPQDAAGFDIPPVTAQVPAAAPRLDQVARPAVQPEIRRVVQGPARKPGAISRQAQAEAQPRLRFEDHFPAYEPPPLSLLMNPDSITRHHLPDEALEENARMLENVLDDYGVKGEIVSVRPGPVVTMYELEPAPGLKASRVIGLADDIARSMSALSARVSTVPGRSVIGIELPNATREKVVLREILSARDFGDSNMRLPLALGKDIGGEPIVANLAKMPHLLIAGTTGSGKSVAINTMILSLLYKLTPEECRLIMIDPKMLELSVYDGIPHLLSPVVTDPKKAVVALKWVVGEMEERYRKMSKMGVRNIEGYNGRVREALAKGEMFKRTIQTGFDDDTGDPVFETDEFAPVAIPYIVVIVDEMADLMMVAGKEIEACIQRLAQMARASGIHLIMATQRPSVDVITGTIKANFPTRISFQVTSKIDSRTILGEQGAEQLLGMGDMLYMAGGAKITRIHGPFVSDEEVEEIVTHLKSFGPPEYMSGVVEGVDEDKESDIDLVLGLGGGENSEDALYDQAVAIVARDRKCSTSYIQRKLGIGYQKAARLVEQMEEQGVVTTANHVGKREILLPET